MTDHFQAGETFFQQGKYKEACTEYAQEIAPPPNNADACKNWENALFKRNYAEAYNGWGNALFNLKEYEEASEKYEEATKHKPDYAEAYKGWGNTLDNLKKYEEAIDKYQQAIKHKPDYAEAYYKWGNALDNLNRSEEAIAKYEKAIAKNPDYAPAYHNIAYIYWKQGAYKVGREKWQDANQAYKRSQEKAKQDKNTDHFLYYGSVLLLLNNLELAQNKYEAGLEINPNNIDILIALVDLYIQKNAQGTSEKSSIDWGKATQYYRQALRLLKDKESLDIESKDTNTLLNFGNLYFSMKEDEKAENCFLKVLEKDGDSASVNNSLGALSIRKEDFKKSIDYFKKALNIDPDDLDVRSNLAQAYLKLKQLTKAESEYRKILGITAKHVESHIGLGEVYVEMAEAGEADIYSQAIRHFTKAIEISNNAEGSKQLSPKELAVMYYLRGYARVKFYENSMVSKDGKLLSKASEDFNNCVKYDAEHYKGERAKDKLKKQIGILSQPQKFTEIGGMLLLGILSLLIFSVTQWFFWQPFFIQAPKSLAPQESVNTAKIETNKNQKTPGRNNKNKTGNANNQALASNSSAKTQPSNQINIAEYFLLTFGSLTFLLMSLYLPQLLKLKIGGTGIELEKSSVGISSTQTTATSLGISK